ncbi:hypothetical protein QBC38DRAFT_529191 [Podospora fimiseda]|uniref:C2H2-type domain-containing protein n=1 Tax=Podospora fimiseda TaxID=252190 RepID=A0AAN7BMY7_9PEZI|nr:hypothetical protein QBC38DRAFT_529191 [Podospora fimiseda]
MVPDPNYTTFTPSQDLVPFATPGLTYTTTSSPNSTSQPPTTSDTDSSSDTADITHYTKKRENQKWFFFCTWPSCKRPDKAYEQLCQLRRHRRSEVKPIKCEFCGQGFQQPKDLARHKKTNHSDKKEVLTDPKVKKQQRKCRYCGRSGRYDNMKRHEENVHPDRVMGL